MNLTANVIVEDSTGIKQTGLTVQVVAHGVTDLTNAITLTEDTDTAGVYSASIPDTYVYKEYDVYVESALMSGGSGVNFGEWIWRVPDVEVTNLQTLTYAELTDSNGDLLPTTIDGASVEIVYQADRLVYLYGDVDNTGFRVGVSTSGESDTATVTFIIKVA